jgi:hypothetical protein
VIASESCLASGVDHCLASEDDRLTALYEDLDLEIAALRRQLRV